MKKEDEGMRRKEGRCSRREKMREVVLEERKRRNRF